MKILIAEDNADSRRLLAKQLTALGHTVNTAANGEEALELAREDPPDVLVSDIMMPQMDGFQLCMEFRLDPQLKHIPVVSYSATYVNDADERFARSLGIDAFVRKPIEIDAFVQILTSAVSGAAGSSPASTYSVEPMPYSGFLIEHSRHLLSKLFSKVQELEAEAAQRREAEERMQLEAQLLDAAIDMICVTDLDWMILYVNAACHQNLGYPTDALINNDLRRFMAPGESQRLEALPSSGVLILETAYARTDGTLLPVEVHSSTILWGGRPVRLSVMRDVTDRKNAEERLQSSHERLARVLQGTIEVVEQMIEVRDPYTSGHQRRVAELAVAIARRMGLPEETCVSPIRTAAVIHDIGKITVPSEILSKPGRLTPAEFYLIKGHPEVGYDIIRRANLPDPVPEVVRQHHERLDGSGYPRGLSGDEILPEAQILAVADVVEAMSSHRPYRPALGVQAALEEIAAGSGSKYYPDVVTACRAVLVDGSFQFNSYPAHALNA